MSQWTHVAGHIQIGFILMVVAGVVLIGNIYYHFLSNDSVCILAIVTVVGFVMSWEDPKPVIWK